MNYQQENDSFYTAYYIKIVRLIKHFLIAEKSKCRNVNVVFNGLTNNMLSTISNRFKVVENEHLKKLLLLFEKRNALYENNQINLIFTNDIKSEFDNIETSKLPVNYTLKKLVKEIAIVTAINDIVYLLNLNRSLFILFYHANDFSKFEIKDYKGIPVEETPLYIELNKIVNPQHYANHEDDYFISEHEKEENSKPYSLPFVIAILNEIGFFELEKIKNFSATNLARLFSVIQQNDVNDKNRIRSISGNIRVLNPDNKEDGFKYTSHKNIEKARILLSEIKLGE